MAVGSQSPPISPIADSRNALSSVSRRLNNTQYCAIEIIVHVSNSLPILDVLGTRREHLQSRLGERLRPLYLQNTKRATVSEITTQSVPSWK